MARSNDFYRWKNFRLVEDDEMDNKMFCFQCEQTAGCKACTGAQGVCGKKADTAQLQDELTGALIGLARGNRGKREFGERNH